MLDLEPFKDRTTETIRRMDVDPENAAGQIILSMEDNIALISEVERLNGLIKEYAIGK